MTPGRSADRQRLARTVAVRNRDPQTVNSDRCRVVPPRQLADALTSRTLRPFRTPSPDEPDISAKEPERDLQCSRDRPPNVVTRAHTAYNISVWSLLRKSHGPYNTTHPTRPFAGRCFMVNGDLQPLCMDHPQGLHMAFGMLLLMTKWLTRLKIPPWSDLARTLHYSHLVPRTVRGYGISVGHNPSNTGAFGGRLDMAGARARYGAVLERKFVVCHA
nr:hypothetical protein CFP56_36169 [Quercus suber]